MKLTYKNLLASLSVYFVLLSGASTFGADAQTSAQTTAAAVPEAPAIPRTLNPVPRTGSPATRHATINQRVKDNQGKADIIMVGDSITQGWEGRGKDVWAQYYSKRNVLNLGIGGDRTEHVLWRLDNGNLEGLHPKVAVVMIGTNNSGNAPGGDSVGDITKGVTAIVRKLQDKLPGVKVILFGIFPRGKEFNDQRGRLLQINQAIQKLDDGKTVFYMDIGYKMIESDGSITQAMMGDALHPEAVGYKIWAEAMEPKIAEILGEKPIQPAN